MPLNSFPNSCFLQFRSVPFESSVFCQSFSCLSQAIFRKIPRHSEFCPRKLPGFRTVSDGQLHHAAGFFSESLFSSISISSFRIFRFLSVLFFSVSSHLLKNSSSFRTLSAKASRFSYCARRTIEGIVSDSFGNSPAVPCL